MWVNGLLPNVRLNLLGSLGILPEEHVVRYPLPAPVVRTVVKLVLATSFVVTKVLVCPWPISDYMSFGS